MDEIKMIIWEIKFLQTVKSISGVIFDEDGKVVGWLRFAYLQVCGHPFDSVLEVWSH
jgi:hypothetical protein